MCDAPRCNAVCLLASGRGIGGAELGPLLAHLHHFILRQQTGELDVLQRAATTTPTIAGAALGSGTSKITKTPGPSAGVLYMPPAASTSFFAASRRLVVGFSMMLLMALGVYCPVRQKCMVKLPEFM